MGVGGGSLGKRCVTFFEMLARRAVDIKPARYYCFLLLLQIYILCVNNESIQPCNEYTNECRRMYPRGIFVKDVCILGGSLSKRT